MKLDVILFILFLIAFIALIGAFRYERRLFRTYFAPTIIEGILKEANGQWVFFGEIAKKISWLVDGKRVAEILLDFERANRVEKTEKENGEFADELGSLEVEFFIAYVRHRQTYLNNSHCLTSPL